MRHSTLKVCCLVLFIQGCLTLRPDTDFSLQGEDRTCQLWLENLEFILKNNALNDPETQSFKDYPQLRINRFLASMAERVTTNDAFAAWLEELRLLDAQFKRLAFVNLPDPARQQLSAKMPFAGSFNQALDYCGKRLNNRNLYNLDVKEKLVAQAQVPDAYQTWKRIVGLYPLARILASFSIEDLHRELAANFAIPIAKLAKQGELIRYLPSDNRSLSIAEITAMLRAAYQNPLGIPRLTSSQVQQLLAHFAPTWEIDTRNDTDKIGAVSLDSDQQPQVDIKQPTVYATHRYAWWRDQVVLQLIYQIWLPAREKTGLLDIYGGPLDSVIWRVTLNPEGRPLAYDSIHGCGCYYLLFPGQGLQAIAPKDEAEPVLSPQTIAEIPPGKRLLLRLQARTHYLQQTSLSDENVEMNTRNYIFLGLEQLRSLQEPNGTKHSLYGEDGIIDASERVERFLLWPFGIASPGAMRQWGAHAIAFIGRRHFDDPFLLENLMVQKCPPST